MWVLWLAACRGEGPADADPTGSPDTAPPVAGGTPTGADTGAPTPEPDGAVLAADCAPAAHPLQVDCTATLSGPGTVTVHLSAATGADPRTFGSEVLALQHAVKAWGLEAETTYDWRIGAITGRVTTGPLPEALRGAEIEVTGAAWFDAVLQPIDCAGDPWFVMIDGDGDIVWYLMDPVWDAQLRGYEWSDTHQTLMTSNAGTFLERAIDGTEVLRLQRGVHFESDLHHDLTRWGDYRYLLFERRVGGLDVDGIYVFDGSSARIGEVGLEEHYPIVGGGAFGDWAHANGLNATGDGLLVLSLLNFDTVIGIDGDPASPTFLQPRWHAVGTARGLPDPTYAPPAAPGEGFAGQHNASLHDGDRLWLFDNTGDGRVSRATRSVLDPVAGEVRVEAAWPLDRRCPIQGGAIPLEPDGVLVSCPDSGEVSAFREGATVPDWTLRATCGAGFFSLGLNRAIPVTID